MRFDSHVADLLEVAAALVNDHTCHEAGGQPAPVVTGAALRERLGRVLARQGRPVRVSDRDAGVLARFASDAREVFEAAADEDADDAAALTNALMAWTSPRPRLDRHEDGWNLHFHGPSDALGEGWAAGCAAALAMTLGSANQGRLGICEAPHCDRVYVDRSKNSTRRFCGLSCQNRVKNTHYRRVRRS